MAQYEGLGQRVFLLPPPPPPCTSFSFWLFLSCRAGQMALLTTWAIIMTLEWLQRERERESEYLWEGEGISERREWESFQRCKKAVLGKYWWLFCLKIGWKEKMDANSAENLKFKILANKMAWLSDSFLLWLPNLCLSKCKRVCVCVCECVGVGVWERERLWLWLY